MAKPAKNLAELKTPETELSEVRETAEVVDLDTVRAQKAKDESEEEMARKQDLTKADKIKKELDEKNESPEDPQVKSAKEKYKTEYLDQNQEKLSQNLEDLINEYKKQKNPQKQAEVAVAFEATVEYCISKGKSTAETVMLSIIHGIAEGVIRRDHIQYYQKYSAKFPALNYILSQNFEDLKKLAKKFSKFDKSFLNFYWSEIVGHPDVKKAINKNADKKIWDHDYVSFAVAGNAETIRQLIAQFSGHKDTTETAEYANTSQENMFAGYLAYFNANKDKLKKDVNHFTAELPSFLIFRSTMNTNSTDIPRVAIGLFGREMTIHEIDQEIWKIITPFEKKLFKMLSDPNTSFDKLQKYLSQKYKINVESMNDFYDKLDEIAQVIFPAKKKWGLFGRRVPKIEKDL
jgi:hypothetical protein